MHDYHAVQALVERLTSELGRLGIERISQVRIHADVTFSPEALEQAYEMLTKDTALEGSRLLLEERPDRRFCTECGASWVTTREDVAGHLLACPTCGALSAIEGTTGIEVVDVTGDGLGEPALGSC